MSGKKAPGLPKKYGLRPTDEVDIEEPGHVQEIEQAPMMATIHSTRSAELQQGKNTSSHKQRRTDTNLTEANEPEIQVAIRLGCQTPMRASTSSANTGTTRQAGLRDDQSPSSHPQCQTSVFAIDLDASEDAAGLQRQTSPAMRASSQVQLPPCVRNYITLLDPTIYNDINRLSSALCEAKMARNRAGYEVRILARRCEELYGTSRSESDRQAVGQFVETAQRIIEETRERVSLDRGGGTVERGE